MSFKIEFCQFTAQELEECTAKVLVNAVTAEVDLVEAITGLVTTREFEAPRAAAVWSGSAKPAPSRREKSAWKPSRRSSSIGSTSFALGLSGCRSARFV